jgi:hypothetical protein
MSHADICHKKIYKRFQNKDFCIVKYNYKKNAAFAGCIQILWNWYISSLSHKITAFNLLKVKLKQNTCKLYAPDTKKCYL